MGGSWLQEVHWEKLFTLFFIRISDLFVTHAFSIEKQSKDGQKLREELAEYRY